MTKTELIEKLAAITGVPKRDVRAVIDALTLTRPGKGLISTCLKNREKVTIAGFGTFHIRVRKARKARNPKTGESVKVAERIYPAFKPARSLKEALKKK